MQIFDTAIVGVKKIVPKKFMDARGSFVKVFHKNEYEKQGIFETDFKEEYYSYSKKNVLRGLHFQTPPSDHNKLIYCVHGSVQDVFLDLRKNSPSFGQVGTCQLDDELAAAIFLPKGVAHGFLTLSSAAIMVYKTTCVYDPANDTGVHWKSVESIWQLDGEPIVSKRDCLHPLLEDYDTPFNYNEKAVHG